jgi:hypothetical protein
MNENQVPKSTQLLTKFSDKIGFFAEKGNGSSWLSDEKKEVIII